MLAFSHAAGRQAPRECNLQTRPDSSFTSGQEVRLLGCCVARDTSP